MKPAIQNTKSQFKASDYINVDDDRTQLISYSTESIKVKYGNDAFEPAVLDVKGSGAELVPKIRLYFSNNDWSNLDFYYRIFIMKAFYESI